MKILHAAIARRAASIFFAAILGLSIVSVSLAEDSSADKVLERLGKRQDAFRVEMSKWKTTTKTDDSCLDPHFRPGAGWKPVMVGTRLPKSETGSWFWASYKIPETIGGVPARGGKVLFYPVVLESGDIYINGVWKGNTYGMNGEFLVTDNAVPGEEYVFVINDSNRYKDGLLLKAGLLFIPQQDLDREVNSYLDDLKTVRSLIEYAPDKNKWSDIVERSAAAVDLDAYDKKDFSKFADSLKSARQLLAPAAEFTRKFSVYLLGYSHIDLAYRWDKREGKKVWVDTTKTVLRMLDKYPGWIYCAGQAAGYQYIEKEYPDLFAQIKKRVAEGRWELVGGMWVEPDSNLPGGESFVRQMLYGQRWFREKFGKDIVVAWTPDSFGFNWNLPQIYKKSGIIGFFTSKIRWNDTNPFPYNAFWWQAPDGSRILAYLAPGDYANSLDTDLILQHLKKMDETHGLKESFEIYGVGDHGGGVTLTSLTRADSYINNPLFPKTKFVTADEYFKYLLKTSKTVKLPVYDNELYLEYHRGTYTTQAATKKNNRMSETALADAELFSSIAKPYGYKYPRNEIRSGWDTLLFNQFHDILPGSSIKETYHDADIDYAKLLETEGAVTDGALQTIAGKIKHIGKGGHIVIFNPLPWKRDVLVEIPSDRDAEDTAISVPDGKDVLPVQTVDGADGKRKALFVASNLPAAGYEVYTIVYRDDMSKCPRGAQCGGGTKSKAPNPLKVTDTTLENEFFKVTLDPKTGNITSLVDKRDKREYFGGGREGNMLQCYHDQADKYDAWNIKLHEQLPVALQSPPEVIERGPVRITISFTKTIGKSTFVHYLSLVRGIPQVLGRIEADWKESHVMAKLAFQLNLKSDDAWYEIPYAAISRAAYWKNDIDRAKWEVSAQKWVDYPSGDGKAGFSLLNNSKYGYDTKDNVLRMSLLRSPKEPDDEADMKHHTIEYSLYPHAGDWRVAQTPRRGYEFNAAALTIAKPNTNGSLPFTKSFFSSEPSNVILSSVKLAEDSNALILRVFEATGKDTTARITLPANAKSVVETNLLEEGTKKVPFKGNVITVPIGHYEIKTLKVTF